MAGSDDAIEALLAQREQIDRALRDQQRNVVVMFTDIVGSTQYFERKGDIEGLALIQRHNGILFPVIEQHRGRVIKTIGDAIMAVFEAEVDGVRCAIAMQRALVDEPRTPGQEPIHIRIGLHGGSAFTVNNDVFGDTVNTASRVAHEAHGDEIVVSRALADRLGDPSIRTLERGSVALKGKAEPLALARVLWQEVDLAAAATRSAPLAVLELGRGPSGLKVSLLDDGAQTVKAYADVAVSAEELDGLASAFAQFGPAPASSYRDRLRELGASLFARTLPDRLQAQLRETSREHLRLAIDDALVHVPFELMHDGKEFLALRFAAGRTVAARVEAAPSPARWREGAHALVVADPTGDLAAARREGEAVAGLLRDGFRGEVRLLQGPVTRAQLAQALRGAALLHWAGHAQGTDGERPGLVLSDGLLSPEELAQLVSGSAPLLVFANACYATDARALARRARGISDLASALLLGGTHHFLGPSFQVQDQDAQTFALRFYEQALAGASIGEAVRQARRALASAGAPTAFGAYVLYGEPREGLPSGSVKLVATARTRSNAPAAAPRAAEPMRSPAPKRRRSMAPLAIGGAGLALVAIGAGVVAVRAKAPEPKPTPTPVVAVTTPPPVTPVTVPAKPAEPPAAPTPHTGPIRICVLPFKNVSGDKSLDYLKDAIAESVTTDFGHHPSFRLIENTQISLDIDYLEQSQSKYVDPATRAAIGKISGAEVVVLGAYQRAGKQVRANARFVDVATGEVLDSVREDKTDAHLLDLQDALSAQLRHSLDDVAKRLRP